MTLRRIALTGIAVVVGSGAVFAATPLGRDLMFHLLPVSWTGEAGRLSAALQIGPGATVADVGAGDGALIVEVLRLTGPAGRGFATESTPDKRQRITARAEANGLPLTVIAAGNHTTNLPDACCDVITMRMVLHHIGDPASFARDLRRSIRAGGRLGIIDFTPGALPHLASDHGVTPEMVTRHLTAAGFELTARDDHWGGRNYLLVFTAR